MPHILLQGKTEALLAVNSMLGFHKRSPCSGDSTKSALFERTSQQADLSVTVDDVVVPQGESRTFQQIIRALYDCSTRTVTGKIRRPKSTAMFTVRRIHPATPLVGPLAAASRRLSSVSTA